MYSTRSGLVLGFHGCDEVVTNSVVNKTSFLTKSENDYDWLGPGIYFWEHDPSRALEYIESVKARPRKGKPIINNPSVLGAVIDLGYCLDLMNYKNLQLIREAHNILDESLHSSNLPQNKRTGSSPDLLIRNLDCAVIKTAHGIQSAAGLKPFDSVRAMFVEGGEIYPNAGFNMKNHVQICICNPNCIKGFFLPLDSDTGFDIV